MTKHHPENLHLQRLVDWFIPSTGFRVTVCASTVDNRYNLAPTRELLHVKCQSVLVSLDNVIVNNNLMTTRLTVYTTVATIANRRPFR